ncbi:hypothetical protein GF337_06870, partial [candidate division KSB1 bacterium]|nr:hypothetical protein [candidate division KSB1 bacterium]
MRFLNKLLLLSLFLLILVSYGYPQEHLLWNFEGTEGLRWNYSQFSSNAGSHGAGNPNSVVNPAPDAVNSSDSCASVKAEVTGSGNGILMYIDYKGGAIDVSVRKMLHIKMKCDQAYAWRVKLTDRNGERSVLTYADYTEVGSWQDLVFNFKGNFETSDGGYFDSTGVYQIEMSAGSPFDLNADVFLDDIRFNADPEPYGKVMTHDLWNFEGIEGLRWNYSQFSSNAGSHGAGNPNSVVNPAPDAVNSSDSCASIKAEVSGSGNGILMYIAYKGGAIDVSELKMLHIKMRCDSAHTWRTKLTDRNGQRSALTYSDYTQVNSWQDLVFNFKGQFVTTDGTPLDSTGVYQIEVSAGEPFDLNTDVFLDEIRFNNDPNPYGGVVPVEPTTPTLAVQESVQSGDDYLVTWTGSINHTRYLLEEDTTDLFASAEPFYLDAGTTSMVFNKVVENDQTFYYRVRAENETTDLLSDWSNVGSTTITTDTTTEAKEHIAYDFEGINNTVQWQLVDFTSVPGATDDWKAFPYSIENPQKVGINTSDSCGHFTAEVESGPQQITIWLTMPDDWVDVTDMPYLHIKMRCEKGAQWKVQLYDGANRTSYVVTEYTNIGQWQDLVFDFEHADLLGADLGTVRHLKFRYEGEMPFYADSLLFDDVKFSSSPVPEGEVPGPTVPELTAPYAALSNAEYSLNWTAAENHTGYVLQEA